MTEKKVRRHMHRIWFHLERLHSALIDAHNADVIQYGGSEYAERAPCAAISTLKERIRDTTDAQVARAVENTLRRNS